MILFLSGLSFAEIRNEKQAGLLLGDPIAISFKIPTDEMTFLNIRAGAWSWHFWNGQINYDSLYLSIDHAWLFPVKQFQNPFYAGVGLFLIFSDNPKANSNTDEAIALRFPLGFDFYKDENITIGFELAPTYQFAPTYEADTYIFDLNGGFTFGLYY